MESKVCTKCEIEKALDCFYPYARGKGGVIARCDDCRKEYHREYYRKNRDRVLAQTKKNTAENIEERRAYWRRYYRDHREHALSQARAHRKANLEYIKAREKRWREKNADRKRAYRDEDRARRAGAEGTYTAEDVQRIYAEQDGRCLYCHKRVGTFYQIDHKIAISRGGTNWPDNLAVACARCNWRKKTKTDEEFRVWLDKVTTDPRTLIVKRRKAS